MSEIKTFRFPGALNDAAAEEEAEEEAEVVEDMVVMIREYYSRDPLRVGERTRINCEFTILKR